MGYALEEIRGKHHSIFVDAIEKDSAEYKEFLAALSRRPIMSGRSSLAHGKNGLVARAFKQ